MAESFDNIDFLNLGRECNQNCRQCYAVEQGPFVKRTSQEQIKLVEKIMGGNPESKFFVYPKETTNNPEFIELISRANQKYIISNGQVISSRPEFLDQLIANNINQLKITLFADQAEQSFWNGNNEEQYENIKKALQIASQRGMKTEIFNIVTPQNLERVPQLFELSRSLGVSKINFIRILPVGNGKNLDAKYFLTEPAFEELVKMTESFKTRENPHFTLFPYFGPDFYSQSVWKFLEQGNSGSWVKGKTICPTINNRYAGLSLKTDNIYWCFLLMSDLQAKIGELQEDKLVINSQPDFSRPTLREKLRGLCSKDNCEYQELCLGGCRSYAYVFAKLRGEAEPEYAGMDLCRTQTKKRLGYKRI